MIHDLPLRWVVTVLFALSAAECGLPIITVRRPWTLVVGHGLHCAMAVAMATMAWPWATRLPTTGPVAFFLLATVWFAVMALRAAPTTAVRVRYGYHAIMMLATAWMYAAMSMPGTAMTAMNMPATSGAPLWFSAANWLGTVGFAGAGAFWILRRLFDRRQCAPRYSWLGDSVQAMMAGGMAVLFLAMLFPI
ncbi:DUF5134 domain-containing protein [Mycobacterium ulcerans]|uniref:DUF5134 domain-containing protein n=3 Tax=Mycobacterium ulcerans TaxID=1809 RepID=A0ABY3V7G2_MYCUL|nr:DUF5134 domain-containing protein [Mycobacterium ulcerans]MEB3969196.1 DUF5134 domain-containing protein [Mycobacterium ulcerans]MEB3977402.1 DUF5134 domain-containing protein [Mycobacterium ulcerans]MEB4006776.1 DUF5134 domain-containing protein [Mycobacterium ulcerans]MEB4416323.1 DUF5134 domain-containing protein [Mycobacterium ulcerans]MEB4434503.1 DUF5134 domain-containing protein [Mycobacterium ulcerans]